MHRCLSAVVKVQVGIVEDLNEVWGTLDVCYVCPEKYITEALDPVVKFRKYKAYEHAPIRKFYSLLRAAMIGGRRARPYFTGSSVIRHCLA
jgi:hypothetical protein